MKANEFVKKFGWNAAYDLWQGAFPLFENNLCILSGSVCSLSESKPLFSLLDLKRLVESHNLVERIGGLCEAKKRLEQADKEFSLLISFRNKYNELCSVYDYVLNQAIADVESCQ